MVHMILENTNSLLYKIQLLNEFPVIMLNLLSFKICLFGTHTLSDKSLRVLQLQTHLSNLNKNGL